MKHARQEAFIAKTNNSPKACQDVVILVSSGAALADISAITQPMQSANKITGKAVYRWQYLSGDGKPVRLSCGAELSCDGGLGDLHRDTLIFLNGPKVSQNSEERILGWIRRQYRVGNKFVLLGQSVFTLARAGILTQSKVAVHWEWLDLFRELFEEVEVADQLYTLGDRFCSSTCSEATTELVVTLIGEQHGSGLCRQVQEVLNRPQLRPPATAQRIPLARRYGTRNQTFLAIIDRILTSFDEDITVQDLSDEFNISRRQLERQFAIRTGMSPLRFIKDCRLKKARQLLQVTDMGVLDIALACGFQSGACFRTAFKRKFGLNPSKFAQKT